MHAEAFEFFNAALRHMPHRRVVVEIGSRNLNGSLRELPELQTFPPLEYIGTDVAPGPGVDVVVDGADYVPENLPDTVLCAEVLEHAANAEAICTNAHRMLAVGGVFILSAASDPRLPHSAVDGSYDMRPGEHYANVSEAMLKAWLKPFYRFTIGTHPRGDIYAVAEK